MHANENHYLENPIIHDNVNCASNDSDVDVMIPPTDNAGHTVSPVGHYEEVVHPGTTTIHSADSPPHGVGQGNSEIDGPGIRSVTSDDVDVHSVVYSVVSGQHPALMFGQQSTDETVIVENDIYHNYGHGSESTEDTHVDETDSRPVGQNDQSDILYTGPIMSKQSRCTHNIPGPLDYLLEGEDHKHDNSDDPKDNPNQGLNEIPQFVDNYLYQVRGDDEGEDAYADHVYESVVDIPGADGCTGGHNDSRTTKHDYEFVDDFNNAD